MDNRKKVYKKKRHSLLDFDIMQSFSKISFWM